ncbi:MAG TPA: vitamin B12 dependent-methionine synthase activation domain-containing protein, partial [Candidatus Tumulicola sp.]|nr:vitamin B12 dependent-methionine synthase activation domain-containing protein [Candidatus Tumulicola sp.]
PGIFYAKDAFEGLALVDALTGEPARRADLLERTKREALAQRDRGHRAPAAAATAPSAVKSDVAEVPRPPFWGARTLERIDWNELWTCFDRRSLFRLSWGAANTKGEAYDRLLRDDFEPRLARYQQRAVRDGWLLPRVAYGYFPAAGAGNAVILYDPQDPAREVARFDFPRQAGGEHLSLADYLREPEGGAGADVVALQVVTVGPQPAQRVEALQAAGEYGESYFLHGFSVQAAEALAEYTHRHVRSELRLEEGRGKRYSWGYGACPDLAQQAIAFELLGAGERIGVALTEAFQIVPEQSTAAIVIHHPRASYFNAAATRELRVS